VSPSLKRFFLPLVYARRDMRAGLKGFYVFLACLVLGVGAIAAIQSLSRGLMESLHHDGRYILGGDIALRTIFTPAPPEQVKFLHDRVGPMTTVVETRAMVRRADGGRSALSELKAVDPFYPLYGALEIVDEQGNVIKEPLQNLILPPPTPDGGQGDEWGALVEKDLLTRLGLHLGDEVYVGQQKFRLRGIISREPDRLGNMRFSLAPRLMFSSGIFDATGLTALGSQVYYDYKVLVPRVETYADIERAQKKIVEAFPKAAWKGRNCFNASPRLERILNRLTLFLTLIGLTTLLIGGIGISNAVRSFLEGKLASIATLKCLGAPGGFVFRVYLLQVFMLATAGIALGLLLGALAAQAAGALLTAKLSLTDQVRVYPSALVLAAAYGYLTTLCFSLWPVGRATRVSPADLFRDLVAPREEKPGLKAILVIIISVQALALLTLLTASDQRLVMWFIAAATLALAAFHLYAELVKFAVKRLRLPAAPEARMAAANLCRPGNISSSVILSLGLGLTVLVAVALVQYNFTRLISDDIAADAPSFFFLDVQAAQRDAFRDLVQSDPAARGLVMTPSFRGRIVRVNGRSAEEALADESESWVVNSDRGFTYTPDLPAHSEITEGAWWAADYSGPPIVSIATNVARAFNIGVGDEITVNILGTDITAKVANVREIDWSSFTMNFAVTFAPGFLEKAPATWLATVITPKEGEEPLQEKISQGFPNITIVRVGDALEAAQTFIRAVAQAVGISAGVTLLAGTLVLAGGIAAARRRHLYDAIILKVLGATGRRILGTFLLEYGFLGIFTTVIAAGLGTAAAWGIQTKIMGLNWKFNGSVILMVTALCLAITLLAGFLGTWRALRQKPAPYLRNQ
jgi:putative ABC transport system permease protein